MMTRWEEGEEKRRRSKGGGGGGKGENVSANEDCSLVVVANQAPTLPGSARPRSKRRWWAVSPAAAPMRSPLQWARVKGLMVRRFEGRDRRSRSWRARGCKAELHRLCVCSSLPFPSPSIHWVTAAGRGVLRSQSQSGVNHARPSATHCGGYGLNAAESTVLKMIFEVAA